MHSKRILYKNRNRIECNDIFILLYSNTLCCGYLISFYKSNCQGFPMFIEYRGREQEVTRYCDNPPAGGEHGIIYCFKVIF